VDRNRASILPIAIGMAGVLHLAIIFGVTFDDIRDRYIPPALEVILVSQQNDSEPDSANFLSQHAQTGGGSTAATKRQTAPVAGSMPEKETGKAAKAIPATSPRETQIATTEAITQIFSEQKIRDQDQQEQANRTTQAKQDDVLQTRMEIARLTSELAREMEEQASRPKTLYVTASTKKSIAANYMLEWVKKVERVGNLNYPSIAYQLSGALVLVVGINQHGGITEIAVKRSSGNQKLDDAAVNIVKLASPFVPMSERLARETDVLYITRTWQFTKDRALSSF